MRTLKSLALALTLAASAVLAQSGTSIQQQANGPANIAGILYAANFGHWTISPTADGNRWTSPNQCFGVSGGVRFPLFSTTAPITIVDIGVPANTETVTPTIASYLGSGCSVGLPAAHPHSNYYLQSGTLGLQEAMNYAAASNAVVVVTPDWVVMGGTSGMLTAATVASSNVSLLDMRTSTLIAYTCSTTCTASGSTGTGNVVHAISPVLTTPNIGAATGASLVLTAVAPTAAAAQIAFGSTTAASSNCGSLSTAVACIVINVAGTVHYIPYY